MASLGVVSASRYLACLILDSLSSGSNGLYSSPCLSERNTNVHGSHRRTAAAAGLGGGAPIIRGRRPLMPNQEEDRPATRVVNKQRKTNCLGCGVWSSED